MTQAGNNVKATMNKNAVAELSYGAQVTSSEPCTSTTCQI